MRCISQTENELCHLQGNLQGEKNSWLKRGIGVKSSSRGSKGGGGAWSRLFSSQTAWLGKISRWPCRLGVVIFGGAKGGLGQLDVLGCKRGERGGTSSSGDATFESSLMTLGMRDSHLEFGVLGFQFWVWGLRLGFGFRVWGLGYGGWGSDFGVSDLGRRVQGLVLGV